jgi:hypothetical protein
MPRGRYVNNLRHTITLPHGQPVGPGDAFDADHSPELQSLIDAGSVTHVEWLDQQPAAAGGIASSEAFGASSIQVSEPPPEQAPEPQPAPEPAPAPDATAQEQPDEARAAGLEERAKASETRSRSRGRKGGDRA